VAGLSPHAAWVVGGYGVCPATGGRTEEALANYTRAMDTARKTGDQRLEIFTANRDRAAATAKAKKPSP
jgi:hypothetical protein